MLRKFAGKQKRFYNICEDNIIIHKDIALFETAMGIVKNPMLNKLKKVEDPTKRRFKLQQRIVRSLYV